MARVLIVDDSPTELMKLRGFLEAEGFQVVEASSGDDAIAKSKAQRPDIIVMDVVMPGMNGFQATRTLSRDPDTKDVPIIVCSSKSQETDKLWAKRQGAADYVVKPVKGPDLLSKIKALLN
ncbi:response regulator [Oceanococcus atlanticus]|uniref:Response regulator n=1 Tax=Oceanococcus atlanticus TaxID=1317117 RepID=A0A1Y1SET8_9GAMM|nr:response regulator [Oceanococcus atlanticus]ORE87506.1 response regulator [Oceanococcus atlanticus]